MARLSQQVSGLKTGINFFYKNRKLIGRRVSYWFFNGFGNNFLDGNGHWMRRINESSVSINFRCKYIFTTMCEQ